MRKRAEQQPVGDLNKKTGYPVIYDLIVLGRIGAFKIGKG